MRYKHMRILLILLFASCAALHAQSIEAMYNPLQKKSRVQSVTAYKMVDGEKYILERIFYDSSGKIVAHGKMWQSSFNGGYTRDTTIFRAINTITICTGKPNGDDSIVSGYDSLSGNRIYTHYKNDTVTARHIHSGDSITNVYTIESYKHGGSVWISKTTGHYTYDERGRVVSRSATDSVFYAGRKVATGGEYYEFVYSDGAEIRTFYNIDDEGKKLFSRSYSTRGGSIDSTVYYTDKGRIRSISVARTDSLARATEYRQTNKRGKLNYRIAWIYNADSIVQRTYGEKGELQYTQVMELDEKGLVVKESEAGIEGSTEVFYEYTYFK